MASSHPVVIVGAGLAGLACARALHAGGVEVQVVDASDGVGGRVRSDLVDGFTLDRGFQGYFTAYPEGRRVLDYGALDLRRFVPGAMVRVDGGFHTIADPFRAPLTALGGILAPVGTMADKLKVLSLRQQALAQTPEEIFAAPERSIADELAALGFSPRIVDRFFTPFLGGIFLDPSLSTTSRMLYFVYRMLSEGDTVVPARGMGAIPAQLASALSPQQVRLNARVTGIHHHDGRATALMLEHGETLHARALVVATDIEQASAITGEPLRSQARAVSCVYFAAPASPVGQPILVLNSDGRGPVLNLAVLTDVAPEYAPAGQHLIAAVVMGTPTAGDADLERDVRRQMSDWYGPDAVAR